MDACVDARPHRKGERKGVKAIKVFKERKGVKAIKVFEEYKEVKVIKVFKERKVI